MIPYNLIFSGLKTGINIWKQRSAEKAAMKHKIQMEELQTGNIRAKRKWSLILDLFLGSIVLAPFVILLIAPFTHTEFLSMASDYINNGLSKLPAELWYLMYIVIGGNFGVSLSHVFGNKQIIKKINKEK